jgi:hypothetical protein
MTDFLNQTEVSKLNGRLLPNKNIFWFNISMEEAMRMDVLERSSDLEDYVSDLLVREGVVVKFAHLHHPVKVHV